MLEFVFLNGRGKLIFRKIELIYVISLFLFMFFNVWKYFFLILVNIFF